MRRIFLCLPLLILFASCGLQIDDAVVLYDSSAVSAEDSQLSSSAEVSAPSEEDAQADEQPLAEPPLEEPLPDEPPTELPSAEQPLEESPPKVSSDAEPEPEDPPEPVEDEPAEVPPAEEDPFNVPPPDITETPTDEPQPVTAESPFDDPSASEAVPVSSPQPEASEEPPAPLPDPSALSNEFNGWYYNKNDTHEPPGAQSNIDLSLYDALYLGDTSQKRVYLTFDAGYEYGFTAQILDTLKEKRVTAAFFIPLAYIKAEPELSARMAADGHVVANHSARHISFPSLTDEEIASELNDTANYFAENTGYPMDAFFRPPAGEYSERTLALTQKEGYTTVFWSFAHVDWLVEEQPTSQEAFDRVMTGLHNGAVILLHAVSEANTNALPDIIDAVRAEGYEFGSLYELKE